jgi:hypothetical protein
MLNNSPRNPARSFDVEFSGGPFDGMQVTVPELEYGLAMAVRENTLRKACGGSKGRPSPPSSVAFYQLVQRPGRWAYQQVRSISARQAHLGGWLV